MGLILRVLWLRWKRVALMRERQRLYQMRAGIDWELRRNASDALACEHAVDAVLEQRRRERFARRFEVKS